MWWTPAPERSLGEEASAFGARRVDIRLLDTPEGPGRARVHHPETAPPRGTILLGHGAGGHKDSADLARLAALLPAHGWVATLVDQPWRVAGRKVATMPPRLDAAFIPMAAQLFSGSDALPRPFVSGGRSAGARVACRTAGTVGADAVVALSFPLHPPGQPDRSRYAELAGALELRLPLVVVQGERDPFGTPAELRAAGLDEARLMPVRGTHTPNPGDLVRAVLTFLDSVDGRPG